MLIDRVALDLPYYDGLLAGHHQKEPGYAIRRARGTDDWLLVATLSGQGRFSAPSGDIEAGPGSLVLLPPGTPHDYGTAGGWEILWVHFHPPREWLEMLTWPTALLHPWPAAWRGIEQAFREVLRFSAQAGRRRQQFSMNALERLLLLCEAQLPETKPIDDRIQQAVEYIHGHLREPLNLEILSTRVHLSPSRFSHLFRKETGMPPLQYISLQRMLRAATLLERTTLTVGEIAGEVGMEPFHFSSRFKAQTGFNPRAYRASRTGKSGTGFIN